MKKTTLLTMWIPHVNLTIKIMKELLLVNLFMERKTREMNPAEVVSVVVVG